MSIAALIASRLVEVDIVVHTSSSSSDDEILILNYAENISFKI